MGESLERLSRRVNEYVLGNTDDCETADYVEYVIMFYGEHNAASCGVFSGACTALEKSMQAAHGRYG